MANAIGAVIIDVKSDISYLVSGMKRAEGVVDSAGNKMINIAGLVATAWTAFSLKTLIDEQTQLANQASLTAQQYAISTEELTKYHYVAEKAGVSTDNFNDALKDAGTKITEFQRDGESAKEAFKALGISQDFAKEKMTTSSDTMKILLQRFEEFPDGMQKATIAQEIFGDEGSNVIRVANLGAEAIKRYSDEAIKGNIATSDAFATKSKTYLDAQNRLEALEGGWHSAVIEESKFLEVGSNIYEQLGDSVMKWTQDVQGGNSAFVDGLQTISNSTNAVFPTVIDTVGSLGHSAWMLGESLVAVGGVVIDLVGDFIGFDDHVNSSNSSLGNFMGSVTGATLLIENFSNLTQTSTMGLKMFGAYIEMHAVSKLNSLQATFYNSMSTISEFLSLIDDDFESDAHRYKVQAVKLEASVAQAMVDGNSKISDLVDDRNKIYSKIHSVAMIKAKMQETASAITLAQKKGIKAIKIPVLDKDHKKNGAESIKILEESTKALDGVKNKSDSASKSTLVHTKAVKSEARAYENLKKELDNFQNVYDKATMDDFDYATQQLKKEKENYVSFGAEKLKVEKWYSIEYEKLTKEKEELELKSQKKLAAKKESEFNAFEEKQNTLFKNYQDQQNLKKKGELAYQELLGNYDFLEKNELEEKTLWFKERGIELSTTQIDLLEKEKNAIDAINSSMQKGIGTFLDGMLEGEDFSKVFESAIDNMSREIANVFTDSIVESMSKGMKTGEFDFGLVDENGNMTQTGANGISALGTMFAKKAFNDTENEKLGVQFGQAAGTAIGSMYGPIGAAVGGAIGSVVGGAIGSALGGGKSTRYAVNADGSIGEIEHTSGGIFSSSSDRYVANVTSTFKAIEYSLEDFLTFVTGFEQDISLSVGTYKDLNDELVTQFFEKWIGLDAEFQNKHYEDFGSKLVSPEKFLSEEDLENMEDAQALERMWSEYAKRKDQQINEALAEVIGGLDATKQSIFAYSNRDSQSFILQNNLSRGAKAESRLEQELAGGQDVNLDNFNEFIKDIKDPVLLERWNTLGNTLVANAQNADAYANYLQKIDSDFYNLFNTVESQSSRNIGELNGRFAELNVSMPKSTTAFYSYVQSIDTTTDAGRKLKEQLMGLGGEFQNVVGGLEATIAGIRNAGAKYASAKSYSSSGIYSDIENYMTVGNDTIVSSIDYWYNQQRTALEATASYQVTIDNSHNIALNEEIELANSLREKMVDVRKIADESIFSSSVENNLSFSQATLTNAIQRGKWGDVQSSFSALSNSAKSTANSKSDYLGILASARQEIIAVDMPEQRELLDVSVSTETHTRDISGAMFALDAKAFDMTEALAKENESSLLNIDHVSAQTEKLLKSEGETREILKQNFEYNSRILEIATNTNTQQSSDISLLKESISNLETAMKEMIEQQKLAVSQQVQQTKSTAELSSYQNKILQLERTK